MHTFHLKDGVGKAMDSHIDVSKVLVRSFSPSK